MTTMKAMLEQIDGLGENFNQASVQVLAIVPMTHDLHRQRFAKRILALGWKLSSQHDRTPAFSGLYGITALAIDAVDFASLDNPPETASSESARRRKMRNNVPAAADRD